MEAGVVQRNFFRDKIDAMCHVRRNESRPMGGRTFVLIELAGEGLDCISSPFLSTQHSPGRVLELLSAAFKSEKGRYLQFLASDMEKQCSK